MATGVTKMQVLSIYKNLMRESQRFANYNFRPFPSSEQQIKKNLLISCEHWTCFRTYALRRVRDAFKANKALTDPKQIKKEYEFAKENLAVIRRQVVIGEMYQTEKLVIEHTG